ncbi:major facilitator superfamily protein [Striga asiatica]|uniref:Major facilitator superfamily protein n=1 Tax=Striga asiatica TaxID=4170 RepID=A0A5A7PDQ2_STRAF|nr:major facilitator superfamily protein [Striga asiatica]
MKGANLFQIKLSQDFLSLQISLPQFKKPRVIWLNGASLPPAHRPHLSESALRLLAPLPAGRLPLPLRRLAFYGWLWRMIGVFSSRESVTKMAPVAVRRWLRSRQSVYSILRSSSRPSAGLGGVLRWWLPTRPVLVRCLRGGVNRESPRS